jgi:hypothetical protein
MLQVQVGKTRPGAGPGRRGGKMVTVFSLDVIFFEEGWNCIVISFKMFLVSSG